MVELMIAMAVGGIVMAAVMTSFLSQHNVYLAQDEVVIMQQNARVAMDMLVRDIRSAGYNPNNLAGAGITTAGITAAGVAPTLKFTRYNNDTGALETIEYKLFDAYAPPDNDGQVDDLARNLDAIAENISRLEFRYLNGSGTATNVLDNIRSVQVSIMVQAAQPDSKSPVPSRTYTTPSGANWTSTAGFRSRYLTTTIECRNLGL